MLISVFILEINSKGYHQHQYPQNIYATTLINNLPSYEASSCIYYWNDLSNISRLYLLCGLIMT